MAVIMPTFLNVMHGQETWQGQHVTEVYGDHTAWDMPFLVNMLDKFFQITQSFGMIDLQEEQQRIDKVHSHSVCIISQKRFHWGTQHLYVKENSTHAQIGQLTVFCLLGGATWRAPTRRCSRLQTLSTLNC